MISVSLKGMSYLDDMLKLEGATQAASMAINTVAHRSGMNVLRQEMLHEINFPVSYLRGDNLRVVRPATPSNLEARIRGRGRPTMLYRFTVGKPTPSTRGGITVKVKPNKTTALPKAFIMQLRSGNLGVVVRANEGLCNSLAAKQIAKGLFLLYAPSVDQVMGGAIDVRRGEILQLMETEFLRQFGRLMK